MFVSPLQTKLSLLACFFLVGLSGQLWAAETQILVSTWELKQHVRQLRQDIQTGQGGATRILDRCSQLLNEHPNHLVQYGTQFLPVQKVILADLDKSGLRQAWTDYAEQAASNLLNNDKQQLSDYIHIAQTYPGTPSANNAWQSLADHAWDRGHLGSYLYYVSQTQDLAHPAARKRVDAAISLLNKTRHAPVPSNLDRVDAIWDEKLPVFRKNTRSRNARVLNYNNDPYNLPYRASTGSTHVLALSNGNNMLILDPLLGRRIGPLHNLGNNNYGSQSNQAFIGDDIIVAVASASRGMQLMACDRLGNLRWRETLPQTSSATYASRPLILDNLIFVCSIANSNSSERITLHAYDLKGNEQWSKTIAQVSGARNRYRTPVQDLGPDLCVHQGRLAILSNRGVIAQVSSNGIIVSLDTYPTKQIDMQFIRSRNGQREIGTGRLSGKILSNGNQIVAAPIDSDAILIQGAQQRQFNIYKGDGQTGSLLDISADNFLIIDDKIRLFNLQDATIKWEHDRQKKGNTTPWGRIGDTHTIIAAGEKLSTHKNDDGTLVSHIDTPKQQQVLMHDELMLFIGEQIVTGRGDSVAFEDNLLSAAKAAPLDYQPRIALAALRRAQGKSIDAFNFLLTAIELGAPKDYSENAAQILRPHLYLQLNNDEFLTYMEHFKRLIAINDDFNQESYWWQARRHEQMNEAQKAIALYKQAAEMEPRIISMSNGLQGNLSSIAQASSNRLQGLPAPWESLPEDNQDTQTFHEWTVDGASPVEPLCSGNSVIGFINGFLRCFDAKTGKQRWRQDSTDILPMLGVSITPAARVNNNTAITVLKGLTADIIGMKHNDVIIKFNEDTVNVFPDLIRAVSKTNCGDNFTVTVKRGEEIIVFKGILGAKPMQATQSNKQTVLCHNVRIINVSNKIGHFVTTPDISNTPYVQVYDINTGALLWHHTLEPKAPLPILTKDDLLIESVDDKLIARYIRREGHPIAWSKPGRGHELIDYQLIGHVLMSTNQSTSRVSLRDVRTGNLLFSVPANPVYELVLKGDNLFSMLDDGHLAMWQLSSADMLWSSQEAFMKPIATSQQSVYCRSSRDELIRLDRTNGAIQRRYPQWSQVYASKENNSTLFIACVNKQHQYALAAIHKDNGNVLWEHPLPPTLQYEGVMLTHQGGVYIRLRSDIGRIGFIHIHNNGKVEEFIPLEPGDSFSLIGNQIAISGVNGLRLVAPKQPKEKPSIAVPEIKGDSTVYQTFIENNIPTLKWTEIANSQFSLFKHNDRLHIVCKFSNEQQRLRVRLGFSGTTFDSNSALLLVKYKELVRLHFHAGWQLDRQCEIKDAGNKALYRAWSMQLPTIKPTAAPLQINIETWHSTGLDIWWLRRNWHRLEEK